MGACDSKTTKSVSSATRGYSIPLLRMGHNPASIKSLRVSFIFVIGDTLVKEEEAAAKHPALSKNMSKRERVNSPTTTTTKYAFCKKMETPTIISSAQQAKKNNFPRENISTTVGESNEQKTTKKISLIIEKFIAEISSCFPCEDLLSDEKEPKKKEKLASVSMEQCTILKPSYIEYSSSLSLFLQQRHKALHQTNQNQNKNPAGRGNISIIDISSPADVLNSIAKLFAAGAGAGANANANASGHQDHNNKKSHQINRARSHNNNYYYTTQTEEEEEEGDIFAIFYIGHGQAMTGDWCWKKGGRISLFDIIWVIKQTNLHQTKKNLFISSDADFSGAWINQLKDLLLFLPTTTSKLLPSSPLFVNRTQERGLTYVSSSSSQQQQQRILFNKDPRAILSLPIKSGLYMRRKFKDSFQQKQQQRRVFPLSSLTDNNSPANIRTTRSIWQQEESLLNYLKNYLSIQTSTNPTEASTNMGVFFTDLDIPVMTVDYYSTTFGLFGQNNQAYIKKRFEDHYHQHPKCYTAFYDKYILTLQKFTPLFRTIDM